ncbi:hypothetical protein ZHAS_00011365 [Anopheles sinensis]|uniref:Uncharacterized protein n=1 Tax=Anopheles sinensis TaxID=74873 RepID=A0A084W008_ANOSI|nr:hypothetical protein ZHAS_00011365 [Anopheles sinensis]
MWGRSKRKRRVGTASTISYQLVVVDDVVQIAALCQLIGLCKFCVPRLFPASGDRGTVKDYARAGREQREGAGEIATRSPLGLGKLIPFSSTR